MNLHHPIVTAFPFPLWIALFSTAQDSFGQCDFDRKALGMDSVTERALGDVEVRGYFRNCPQKTAHCETGISAAWAAVRPLLNRGRPSAVGRLVVAVIITTINGLSGRLHSHVGEEVLEGFSPAFTDRDPTPPIVGEAAVAGIVAASLHSLPSGIGGCGEHPVAFVATPSHLLFAMPAPAAFHAPTAKAQSPIQSFLSAVANTLPTRLPVGVSMERHNGESPKFLACNINSLHTPRNVYSGSGHTTQKA